MKEKRRDMRIILKKPTTGIKIISDKKRVSMRWGTYVVLILGDSEDDGITDRDKKIMKKLYIFEFVL